MQLWRLSSGMIKWLSEFLLRRPRVFCNSFGRPKFKILTSGKKQNNSARSKKYDAEVSTYHVSFFNSSDQTLSNCTCVSRIF